MGVLINLVLFFIISTICYTSKMRYRGSKIWARKQPLHSDMIFSELGNSNYIPYDIYYETVDSKEKYDEPSYLVANKKSKSSKRRFSRNNKDNSFSNPKQKLLSYLSHETYIADKVKDCLDINIIMYLKKHKVMGISNLILSDFVHYERTPVYELLYIMENQCRDIEYLLSSSVQEILDEFNKIDESEYTEISEVKEPNIVYSLAQDLDNNYNVVITDAPNMFINTNENGTKAINEALQNKSKLPSYEDVSESLDYFSNEEKKRAIYIQDKSVQNDTVKQNDSIYNKIKLIDTATDSGFILNKTTQFKQKDIFIMSRNINENVELENETTNSINENEHNKAVTSNMQGSYELHQILNTDYTSTTIIRENTVYPEETTTELFENYDLNTIQAKIASVHSINTLYPVINGQDINAVNRLNKTKHSKATILTVNSEIVTQNMNDNINDIFENIGDTGLITDDIISSTPPYVNFTSNIFITDPITLRYKVQKVEGTLDAMNKTHAKLDTVRLKDIELADSELVTAATFNDFTQSEVIKSTTYDGSNIILFEKAGTNSEKSILLEDTQENSTVSQTEKLYDDIETSTLMTVEDIITYRSQFIDDLETTTSSYLLTAKDKSKDTMEAYQINKDDDYITIIAKDTEIPGQLYFHHNHVQIPLYFKQSLDGKVTLNINGSELCDKIRQKEIESLLLKALCTK